MEEPERKASSSSFSRSFSTSSLFAYPRCPPPPPPPPPVSPQLNPPPKKKESTIGAAFLTKSMPDHGVKFEIW